MKSGGTLATVARQLNRASAENRLRPVVFLTDSLRVPDPVRMISQWPRSLASEIMVIFRHYDAPDRARLAGAVAGLCRARAIPLLVGADPALALSVGAAGVHWPEGLLRERGHLVRPSSFRLQTVAAHDLSSLLRAEKLGADAALVSPVFATDSHLGAASLGAQRFSRLVRSVRLPVYALGGVRDSTARRLAGSGAIGLAAMGAFLTTDPDPK